MTKKQNFHLLLSSDHLSTIAVEKLRSSGFSVRVVSGRDWLLGVELKGGQTVAAYPISRLNPLAAPAISMTDTECDRSTDYRQPIAEIARRLLKWCKDDDLIAAIKHLVAAIRQLET